MQLEQRAINYPVYVAVRYGGAQANRQARSLPVWSALQIFPKILDLQEPSRAACAVAGIYIKLMGACLLL